MKYLKCQCIAFRGKVNVNTGLALGYAILCGVIVCGKMSCKIVVVFKNEIPDIFDIFVPNVKVPT